MTHYWQYNLADLSKPRQEVPTRIANTRSGSDTKHLLSPHTYGRWSTALWDISTTDG
jgi:hypothetical protein